MGARYSSPNTFSSTWNPYGQFTKLPAAFYLFWRLIRDGLSSKSNAAWYDRLIWVVGGFMMLLVFGGGLVLLIIDKTK
jgi:hypothetical protein